MSESDDRYSKVEREIIEILDEMGDDDESRPDNIVDFRSARSKSSFSMPKPRLRIPGFRQLLTPGKLLAFALIFALLALFGRNASTLLAGVFAVLSVLCFASLLFVRSGPSTSSIGGTQTKRWRGRDIEFGPSHDQQSTNAISRWWNSRKRQ